MILAQSYLGGATAQSNLSPERIGLPLRQIEYSKVLHEYLNILRLIQMPLYIKDDEAAELVARLAKLRSLNKQDAVWLAIQVELDRPKKTIPLRARLQALQAAYSLPPPTGRSADKGFFDDLSGRL